MIIHAVAEHVSFHQLTNCWTVEKTNPPPWFFLKIPVISQTIEDNIVVCINHNNPLVIEIADVFFSNMQMSLFIDKMLLYAI